MKGNGQRQIPQGIYVLTDHDQGSDEGLYADVAQALRGGAAMIQYRDKSGDSEKRQRQATELLRLCQAHSVPLIINDDTALCAAIGADGVHLGRDDGEINQARQSLPEDCLIGVSCYNELERARQAATAGADYLAFGSVFPSESKPDAVHCPLPLLEMAAKEFEQPICAIGGIGPANIGRVRSAGASLAAVIGSAWQGAPDHMVRQLEAAYQASQSD